VSDLSRQMPCPLGDMSQLGFPLLFAAAAISASKTVACAASSMKQITLSRPVTSAACAVALTVSAAVLYMRYRSKSFSKHGSSEMRDNLREYLLGPNADDVASISTIEQASDVFFGDSICLYGLSPRQFQAAGVRLCNRTVIECTNDRLAIHTSLRVRSLMLSMDIQRAIVVDIMCGSGNLMMHFMKKLQSPLCLGFESNACVAECTRTSLAAVLCSSEFQSRCQIITGDWIEQFPLQWQRQIAAAGCLPVDAAIFVIAPPWGDGFCFERGLDFARTHPPVGVLLQQLVETVQAVDTCGRLMFACVQTHEKMVEVSMQRFANVAAHVFPFCFLMILKCAAASSLSFLLCTRVALLFLTRVSRLSRACVLCFFMCLLFF
jgi:hypothetical protein